MSKKSFDVGDVVRVMQLKDAPEMLVLGSGLVQQIKCFWFTAKGRAPQEHMLPISVLALVRPAAEK